MAALFRLRALVRNLLRRSRVERDLDDELRATFDTLVEECVAAGMDRSAARRAATLRLGRVESIATAVRQTRSGAGVDSLLQDLTFGARLLRRNPLFTATAVLSLALGIGATTTMFSLVNALLLRDVRVSDPGALVELWRTTPLGGRGTAFSYPAYERVRDENGVFIGVLALSKNTVRGTAGQDAGPAGGRYVSGNFFDVLGLAPSGGRLLSPRDDRLDDPAAAAVAVISHRLWRRAFGGSPDAIGQTVRVDPVRFTVIGIAPAAFDDLLIGRSADFYIPMASEPLLRKNSILRSAPSNWIGVVGRLKPGVTRQAAQAGLEPVFARFLADLVLDIGDADMRRRILSMRVYLESARNGMSDIRRDATRPVLLLMGAVVLVLLIACANVVNLLLASGVSRRREIALRLAIGASRARVFRQLLSEAMLLGGAGALCGIAMASFGAPVVSSLIVWGGGPLDLNVEPDVRVALFAGAGGLLSSLIAGVLPALRGARADLTPSFQDARTLRVTRESTRWGRLLIAAQVALSVVLLAGASLLVATLRNIHGFHPGFAAERVVLFSVDPARVGYTGDRLDRYHRDVLDSARAVPGVAAASLSRITPISGGGIDLPIAIEGRPRERDVMVYVNRMTEGFFDTMSIPLLLGRDFVPADATRGRPAVIVNDALARKYFPGTNPIGRQLTLANGPASEIVGVAANSKYLTLRDPDMPTAYSYIREEEPGSMTLSVRTAGDPLAAAAAIREQVVSVAAEVPVSQARTLSSQVERSLASERLIARLLSVFAVLALVLASVGLYGVLGHAVARRTAEIGLRLALGATRRDVLRAVIRESLTVVGLGLAVGLPATTLLKKPLEGLLYDVAPSDPVILGGAVVCLVTVGLAAAAAPALRAARVDPIVALRHE